MTVEAIKSLFSEYGHYIPYAYLGVISLIAIIMTVSDKRAAKKPDRERIPEARLWTVAALGGSIMMYAVMKIIHHKTKHPSFMVGLPVMIILQFAIALALLIIF